MFRKLGGENVPTVGLGCMGMSEFYGKTNDETSLKTLSDALDMGYQHFDTADMYGAGHNEQLIGRFIKESGLDRNKLFLSTKGGIVRDPNDKYSVSVNCSEKYIRNACENSLRRLNTDYIDLYYLHRLDPNVALEESLGTLKDLVKEGKIKNIGLCEVSGEQLDAAHKIHPIASVQSELSLWSRDSEDSVIPKSVELDVAFVAFSPLGRGFLSGNIDKKFMDDASDDLDFRKRLPRFSDENIAKNIDLVKNLENISQDISVPVSQIALNWVLAKSPNIHIIPGTKTSKHLKTNFDSQFVALDSSLLADLDTIFSSDAVHGSRYPQKILDKSS